MATALTLQWTDGTLLAASGSASSGWLSVDTKDKLHIIRTHAGGTYALEIEWSRDGSTTDITETVTTTNDARTSVEVAAPYAKVTVKETGGTTAFTTHRTTVYAR